jgi:hypothetical protein
MRRFRSAKAYFGCLLAVFAIAAPVRAAITVFSDPADISLRPSNNRVAAAFSTLGTRSTPGDEGSRTVIYVFQLPQSDTGISQVKSATFSFTSIATPANNTALSTPSNYGIDLYALPARATPDVLDSDNFSASPTAYNTVNGITTPSTLITPNLFPIAQPIPVGEILTNYAQGSTFVNFLNTQYGADGSGAGKYIFLRLNTNGAPPLTENSGGYVNMSEATTGRPYLAVTFVPEPSLATAGALLLAATTFRRRPRHQD